MQARAAGLARAGGRPGRDGQAPLPPGRPAEMVGHGGGMRREDVAVAGGRWGGPGRGRRGRWGGSHGRRCPRRGLPVVVGGNVLGVVSHESVLGPLRKGHRDAGEHQKRGGVGGVCGGTEEGGGRAGVH